MPPGQLVWPISPDSGVAVAIAADIGARQVFRLRTLACDDRIAEVHLTVSGSDVMGDGARAAALRGKGASLNSAVLSGRARSRDKMASVSP